MKWRNLYLGLLICLIGGYLFLRSSTDRGISNSEDIEILSESEIDKLQEGDLILRRGYGIVSTFILKMMNERFPVTHIGVLSRKDNSWYVVHSLSSSYSEQDGIQIQSLKSFVADSYKHSILISRLKDIDKDQIERIKEKLNFYLDQKIPFDHQFDYRDNSAFYCSELIWQIYEKDLKFLQLPDDLSDKEKYHTLTTFYDRNYFDIIVNHHQ